MADFNGDPWELRAYHYGHLRADGTSERRTAYELMADVDSGPDMHRIVSEFDYAATPATLRLIEKAPELYDIVKAIIAGFELNTVQRAVELFDYIENGDLPNPGDPIDADARREGMAEDYGRDRRSGE